MKRFVVVAALVLLASCNRGDDPTVDTADASTSSSSSTSSSVAETTSPSTAFVPGALPAARPASATRAYLAAVRVAAHDGFDRVVFEFEDAVPGYRVDITTRPVTEDGSGDAVEVKGEVLYEVRFENAATARFQGERVVPVYQGERRITTRGEVVEEAVRTGDFEGVVTWVIGARPRPEGVRVTTLASPFRVVVDLGSPR
ncbi:MAG TPA: hypothetical protein VM938_08210 [Acidimicrobiales bacterium]|nr:hypothetical protein [Acidimicrobiales bacterium]